MKTVLNSVALFIALLLLGSIACAQDGGRKELKTGSNDQAVKSELAGPDGASLRLLPDGGWRIYGQGSATYDFNEVDEIRGATQNATLRAKGAISKMLKERVQTTEVMNNVSTKLKEMTKVGANVDANVSKTEIQQRVENIVATSDEVLRGIVVIETKKTPAGSGGTITVTVGVSSKTQQTMDSIKANKAQPQAAAAEVKPAKVSGAVDIQGADTVHEPNVPVTQKAKTDF